MKTQRANFVLTLVSIPALVLFGWPLLIPALPSGTEALAQISVLLLAPIILLLGLIGLDREVSSSKYLATLGILAALGSAIRIATSGVGGFEAVFVLIILAGRAFGPRFGFLLGVVTIASSSIFWGGFGPWTAFQMFAVGWVGLGAGLLPKARRFEIWWLAAYTVVASYLFGLIMNLWFWPYAVGTETSISFQADGTVFENLGSFLIYSLTTSTLSWDTVRAITVTAVIAVFGKAILATLRRAKLKA